MKTCSYHKYKFTFAIRLTKTDVLGISIHPSHFDSKTICFVYFALFETMFFYTAKKNKKKTFLI